MTTPFHAVLPALVTYVVTGNTALSVAAGGIGTTLDVINNKYYKLMPNHNVYNFLHRYWLHLNGIWLWLMTMLYVIVYPLGMHCACDYFFHTDTDGMRNLEIMIAIEVGFWLAILAWICLH